MRGGRDEGSNWFVGDGRVGGRKRWQESLTWPSDDVAAAEVVFVLPVSCVCL